MNGGSIPPGGTEWCRLWSDSRRYKRIGHSIASSRAAKAPLCGSTPKPADAWRDQGKRERIDPLPSTEEGSPRLVAEFLIDFEDGPKLGIRVRDEGGCRMRSPTRIDEPLRCDLCGRKVTEKAAIIGFGRVNCQTCEEWATGQCLECGGDLHGKASGRPCTCQRDEKTLAAALTEDGFDAFVGALGGGLIGVTVSLGTRRYALITRHEGPWIIGPHTDDELDEVLLRGHEEACPGVLAAEAAEWAVPTLRTWAA